MSRGNLSGGDPLQRGLELQEYLARLHREQLPRPASPPMKDIPVITEGLQYPRVPTTYQYPSDFEVGTTDRVFVLNRIILRSYGVLGWRINKHAHAQAIRNHNQSRPGLKRHQLCELNYNVNCARSSIDNATHHIVRLLNEVDAVGGSKAYYIPDELKKELGTPLALSTYKVPSGSLARLAEKPNYIPEKCDVPSNIYMGNDTECGRTNQQRKIRFEKLAFSVNRIQFLVDSGHRDFFVTRLQDNLRTEFDEAGSKTGEGYLTMPTDLHKAIVKILSTAQEERKVAEAEEKKKREEMLYEQEYKQKIAEADRRKKKREKEKGKK